MADRRHKRRERSRAELMAALERLKTGNGTHPKHIGIKVRITKEAVAREARKSPATLYRLSDVVDAIDAAVGARAAHTQRVPAAEQRRRALVDEIESLKHKNALLVAENFRLMRLLAKHDPSLGQGRRANLAATRGRKRNAKHQGAS